MASRITELVLNCRDAEALSDFWCAVLDWVELDREEDGGIEIGPADRNPAVPTIILSPGGTQKSGPLPLHLDVNATDRDQAAELERLLALGARRADVGQTGEESWHVLQDPEGNEFCLLRSTVAPI